MLTLCAALAFVFSLAPCQADAQMVALIHASGSGEVNKVSELVERGVNIEGVALDGWTPLTNASSNGQLDVVKFLLSHGAHIDRGTGDIPEKGVTPLFLAAFNDHVDVVQFLISKGGHLKLDPVLKESFISRVNSFKNPALAELVKSALDGDLKTENYPTKSP